MSIRRFPFALVKGFFAELFSGSIELVKLCFSG